MLITTIRGNPNVGLYAYANDHYCLVGRDFPEKLTKEFEKTLKVPVHKMDICGTSLLGVFLAGNNHILLVPDIAFPNEIQTLDKLKIKYELIKTKHTALGNNLLINEHGCLANPEMELEVLEKIHNILKIPLQTTIIAGVHVVGSSAVLNKKGCLIHRDASDEDIKLVEGLLKTKCEQCTVNMGNPYVKSGIVCNNHDYVVGEHSGGPELQVIDNTLRGR